MSERKINNVDIVENPDHIAEVCREHQVQLLILFGSASGEATHAESDIDLAYKREEAFSLVQRAEFIQEIKPCFPEQYGRIDLVWLTSADPLLLHQISKTARFIYGAEDDFKRFTHRAFHKYADFKPFLKREREEVIRRLDQIQT